MSQVLSLYALVDLFHHDFAMNIKQDWKWKQLPDGPFYWHGLVKNVFMPIKFADTILICQKGEDDNNIKAFKLGKGKSMWF